MRERFFKLRDKLLNTTPKICIERAKIVTEAYKKYDAYPNIEKRAMALADVLRNMTIYIEEEQLLADTLGRNIVCFCSRNGRSCSSR